MPKTQEQIQAERAYEEAMKRLAQNSSIADREKFQARILSLQLEIESLQASLNKLSEEDVDND